jgi:hypothetical protein
MFQTMALIEDRLIPHVEQMRTCFGYVSNYGAARYADMFAALGASGQRR